MPQLTQVRLNGGEINDELSVRGLDQERVSAGVRTSLNFVPQRGGGSYKRTGFEFKHLYEFATSSTDNFLLRSIHIGDVGYLVMIGVGFIRVFDAQGNWLRRFDGSGDDGLITGPTWQPGPLTTVYIDPVASSPGTLEYPYRVWQLNTTGDWFELELIPTSTRFAPEDLRTGQWTYATHINGQKLSTPRYYVNWASGTFSSSRLDFNVHVYTDYTEEHLRALDDEDTAFTKIIANENYPLGALVRTSERDVDWFYGSVDYVVTSEDPNARVAHLNLESGPLAAKEQETVYEYAVAAVDQTGREGPPYVLNVGLGPNVPTTADLLNVYFNWWGYAENTDAGDPKSYSPTNPNQWEIDYFSSSPVNKWLSFRDLGITGGPFSGGTIDEYFVLVAGNSASSWPPANERTDEEDYRDQIYPPVWDEFIGDRAPFRGKMGRDSAPQIHPPSALDSPLLIPTTDDNALPSVNYEFLYGDAGRILNELVQKAGFSVSGFDMPFSGNTIVLRVDSTDVDGGGLYDWTDPNTVEVYFDFEPVLAWKIYRRSSRAPYMSAGVVGSNKRHSLAAKNKGEWKLLHAFFTFGGRDKTGRIQYFFKDGTATSSNRDIVPVDTDRGPIFPPDSILVKPGQYPHRAAFLGDRLMLARSQDLNNQLWAGYRGEVFDFGESSFLDAYKPFNRQISSDTPIEYIVGDTDLLVFSGTNTVRVWDPSGTIAASTVRVDRNGDFGCFANVKPVQIDQGFVFVNRTGESAHLMFYEESRKKYVGQPLSQLAAHIWRDVNPIEGAYTGDPFRHIWWVSDRKDEMPLLLLSAEDELASWARMRVRPVDEVFTMTSVPQPDGPDALFVGVRRPFAGSYITTIERLTDFSEVEEEEIYLDGAVSLGLQPSIITYVASNGPGVAPEIKVNDEAQKVYNTDPVTPVFIQRLRFVYTGSEPHQLRADISNFPCFAQGDAQGTWHLYYDLAATLPCDDIFEVTFAFSAPNADDEHDEFYESWEFPDWKAGKTFKEFTGAEHLVLQQVTVIQNGTNVTKTSFDINGDAPALGGIGQPYNLPYDPMFAYAGFPYPNELETYDLSAIGDPYQAFTKTKVPTGVRIRVIGTPRLEVAASGGPLSTHKKELVREIQNPRSVNRRADMIVAPIAADHGDEISVRIRQDDPFAAKILAITPDYEVEEYEPRQRRSRTR